MARLSPAASAFAERVADIVTSRIVDVLPHIIAAELGHVRAGLRL